MEQIVYLTEINTGDVMVWSACAQTSYQGDLTLMDDTETYASIHKDNGGGIDLLGSGKAFYNGGENLRIVLSMPESSDLHYQAFTNPILKPSEEVAGTITSICYEDSINEDFNDFYFNIVAWREAD